MADFFVDQGINLVLSQVFGNHFSIVVKETTEPWLKKAGRNMR